MSDSSLWRSQLAAYIRAEARPVDKYAHQPRLYALACQLARAPEFVGAQPDDDILYAACWLHDLGVFIGHRPEDLAELAAFAKAELGMSELAAWDLAPPPAKAWFSP